MGKKFSVGMEGEKDTGGKEKIPEGDQVLIIKKVELISAEDSGSGNPYFKWLLVWKENEELEIKVVTTLKKGVRWLLKQLLSACGIEAKTDDPAQKYDFSEEGVIDKEVIAYIQHVQNEFTGRDGRQVKHKKAEVKAFKKVGGEESKKINGDTIPF